VGGYVAIEPEPEVLPKRGNKLLTMFLLCALFAFGGIMIGGYVGYAASNRYQVVQSGERNCYRIDRLTGNVWLIRNRTARPVDVE
jgi:hypothetical protein